MPSTVQNAENPLFSSQIRLFPRCPEPVAVLPIIPEAVSVVRLVGTVAFRCSFALKSALLTGLVRNCKVTAVYLYYPAYESVFPPINRERTTTLFQGSGLYSAENTNKTDGNGRPRCRLFVYCKCNFLLISTVRCMRINIPNKNRFNLGVYAKRYTELR